MKGLGLVILFIGAVGLYFALMVTGRADSGIRAFAALVAIVALPFGWYLFFEGLKEDIIRRVREELRKELRNAAAVKDVD